MKVCVSPYSCVWWLGGQFLTLLDWVGVILSSEWSDTTNLAEVVLGRLFNFGPLFLLTEGLTVTVLQRSLCLGTGASPGGLEHDIAKGLQSFGSFLLSPAALCFLGFGCSSTDELTAHQFPGRFLLRFVGSSELSCSSGLLDEACSGVRDSFSLELYT